MLFAFEVFIVQAFKGFIGLFGFIAVELSLL
jgi:hypothetical protein